MERCLKYAVIFLGAFITIYLFAFFLGIFTGIGFRINFLGRAVATFFGYDTMIAPTLGQFALMILVSATFWFIIGALIGLIVEKINNF